MGSKSSAFISHSFENKPEFDNIVDSLEQRDIPYWNPADVKPGSSLREQLKVAVEKCGVCIFVATRHAIESSWCGAELGAFWGAGKPVLVYLAEPSLKDDELPPIVQGDVWERRISRIADRAKELLLQAASSGPATTVGSASLVSNMTIEELEKLIVGVVSLAAAGERPEGSATSFDMVGKAAKSVAGQVLAGTRAAGISAAHADHEWHNKILWVDDRPENNVYERQAFESMGLEFTLALSTKEALAVFAPRRFAAIISDMGRKEGKQEGYVLLEAIRKLDMRIPFFIYAGSAEPEHKRQAAMRGAQGMTNVARDLVDMVIKALPTASDR